MVVFSKKQVLSRISSLAKQINNFYCNSFKKEVVIVAPILNGGMVFTTELLRYFRFEYRICPITIKKCLDHKEFMISYHEDWINDKTPILLVDGIVDTCSTLNDTTKFLINKFSITTPAIESVALVQRQKYVGNCEMAPTWVGFLYDGDEYLYGMGMDKRNGTGRGIPLVAIEC